ncbi:MAG: hypothetical protein OXF01_14140 [Gemmatimonadetes bacterium]|nr:hypothetical protein [Gemmatimonadota bacterium]
MARLHGHPRPVAGRPRVAAPALLAFVLAVIAGCATAGAVAQNFWREDLGSLNQATIEAALTKIIQKHSLQLNQVYDQGGEIRWELTWISREVVAEEELRGVTNARNRIVIRGVESRVGNVDNYRMTWELANEVTTESNGNWHPAIVPASVIAEFQPVYADLTLEVRTGVRR